MCSSQKLMDPFKLVLSTKTNRVADPLGLTKTAIGDPTGRFRKLHAAEAKKNGGESPYPGAHGYRRITTALGAQPAYGPAATALGGG